MANVFSRLFSRLTGKAPVATLAMKAPAVHPEDRRQYREPSYGAVLEVDRVSQVRSALTGLMLGQFQLAALLCDQMKADGHVAAAFMQRTLGLLGTPLGFEPANDSDEALEVAKLAKQDWRLMFPVGEASELHDWGLLLSVGIGRLSWQTEGPRWIPRLRPWHGQFINFDTATDRYYVHTDDGTPVYLPRVDQEPHSDGGWVIYTPHGWKAWRRALARPVATPWLIKQWAQRDWARHSEVHGQPIRKGIVPAAAPQDQKDTFFNDLRSLAADGVILLPDGGPEGGKFDVDLLEAESRSFDGFEKLITKMETSVGVPVLGHGHTLGSAGNSTVNYIGVDATGSLVRPDLKAFDAETLATCYQQQVLYWWAKYNFGDGNLAPLPLYELRAKAPGGDGKSSTPMLTPSDVGAIVSVNEGRASQGLGPLTDDDGKLDPDGKLTIAEYKAKHAATIGEAAAAEKGTPAPMGDA